MSARSRSSPARTACMAQSRSRHQTTANHRTTTPTSTQPNRTRTAASRSTQARMSRFQSKPAMSESFSSAQPKANPSAAYPKSKSSHLSEASRRAGEQASRARGMGVAGNVGADGNLPALPATNVTGARTSEGIGTLPVDAGRGPGRLPSAPTKRAWGRDRVRSVQNLKNEPRYVSPKLYTKVELTVTWSTDS